MEKTMLVSVIAAITLAGTSGGAAVPASAASSALFRYADEDGGGSSSGSGGGGTGDSGDHGSNGSELTIQDDPVQQQEPAPGWGSATLEGAEGVGE